MASVLLRPAIGTVVLASNGIGQAVSQFPGVGVAPLSTPDASGGRLYPTAFLYPSATVWPGVGGLPATNVLGDVALLNRIGAVSLAPSIAGVDLQTTT